jgi:hypothetical protein
VGIADLSKITPLNPSPISGTSFQTTLGEGQYTAAVEAMIPSGTQGKLSSGTTFKVRNRAEATDSLTVWP